VPRGFPSFIDAWRAAWGGSGGRLPEFRTRYAALVRSGWDPASIGRLADLIKVKAARAALEFFWERKEKRKTEHLHRFALLMAKLAKHWVRQPIGPSGSRDLESVVLAA
jgi:hypothetical protein